LTLSTELMPRPLARARRGAALCAIVTRPLLPSSFSFFSFPFLLPCSFFVPLFFFPGSDPRSTFLAAAAI
jgi:hypothetical protein